MDRIYASEQLKPGDIVKVVQPFGAPHPNYMGQCLVEKDGVYIGRVYTSSLHSQKETKTAKKK